MSARPPAEVIPGSVEYWAALKVSRGHATTFATNSPGDRRIMERATVREWAKAVEAVEKCEVTEISPGPDNAFPDFTAKLGGNPISIELTELLHSKNVLRDASKGQIAYENIQWTETHFRQRVQERLCTKGNKILRSDGFCDVLVLHTAEPWLSPCSVKQWLAGGTFPAQQAVGSAYLLMTYVPDWATHWPIFRL